MDEPTEMTKPKQSCQWRTDCGHVDFVSRAPQLGLKWCSQCQSYRPLFAVALRDG